jgi:hypothetical protein
MGEIFGNNGMTPNNTEIIGLSEGLNVKFIGSQYTEPVTQ